MAQDDRIARQSERPSLPAGRLAFFAVGLTTLTLPLLVDRHGEDSFRLPKELVFRGGAIVVLLAFVFALTAARPLRLSASALRRPAIVIPLVAVGWTIVITIVSTNRILSVQALITVVCGAILFIGVYWTMKDEAMIAFDIALVPAVINAVLVILQEYRIWQPFTLPPEAQGHLSSTALIGNPNDVGTYLIVPAVAVAIGTVAARGWRRAAYAVTAAVLLAGLVASETRTALFSYAAAIVAFIAFRSRRNIVIVAILLLALLVVLWSPLTPVGPRIRELVHAAQQRNYQVMFSERLPPFLAAIDMFIDHPVVGVGAGCFSFEYMKYRMALAGRYPARWTRGSAMNWGEAHNDHLQLLAEGGLPAYAIFIAALFFLARPSRHSDGATEPRRALARELRLPLTVAILIVALAQFPLQIAAPRMMFLYFSALVMGWDDADA